MALFNDPKNLPSIFRNAWTEFTNNGVPDGVVYIEGIRGTLSSTSAGLIGSLVPSTLNAFKSDFVPTAGTVSVSTALNLNTDSAWSAPSVKSGNSYIVTYLSLQSAGQTGRVISDSWTAT